MKPLYKHGIGGLIGLLIGGGAVFGGLQEDNTALTQEVKDAKAEKVAILSQYIYSQIRLGSLPTFDLTFVSSQEANDAYLLAVKTNGADQHNLNQTEALVKRAQDTGVACVEKPLAQPDPVPIAPLTQDAIAEENPLP